MNNRQSAVAAAPVPAIAQTIGLMLQRKCGCGQHTVVGGACSECKEKKGTVQRKASTSEPANDVPPIVHQVLASPGQPLDDATRAFMEPRFGHDFSTIPTLRAATGVIQTKLALSEPGDEHEREADRVADEAMAAPAHADRVLPRIQRFAGPSANQTDTAPPSVDRVLAGSGTPLGATLRQDMERRFGYDLSAVRVHSDTSAAQSARDVSARAYTVGHDIVFGAGQFSPDSFAGRRLLAHELTHVVQQTGADPQHANQLSSQRDFFPGHSTSRLSPTLQGKSTYAMLSRKCDVDPALDYYAKTAAGKKVAFDPWLEKMRKVAGTANKALYDDAKAEGKIGGSFVVLVCKGQELLNILEDGKIGGITAAAFDQFSTGGKKGIDYSRLFTDRKLEVGIAIGDEFKSEFDAIVTLLEAAGSKLKGYSSVAGVGSKVIKFTKDFPVQGDNTAKPIPIDLEFNIIHAGSATPKKTYAEFLSTKELVIYSGHARYGTGPDFDDKKTVKENFIIGVNSALHKAGKLTSGYDAHMNKILDGYANDLEAMSKAGKIDPDKYQVWFFNACSSINYLDEVRKGLVTDKGGKTKSKANLRFVGTTESIYSDALKIVDSILNMKTIEQIINIMNINEKAEVKAHGEKEKPGYYFSD
ncbi:MAG: DUF4157 domain-containing protein [Acidobacteriota bacterium]